MTITMVSTIDIGGDGRQGGGRSLDGGGAVGAMQQQMYFTNLSAGKII